MRPVYGRVSYLISKCTFLRSPIATELHQGTASSAGSAALLCVVSMSHIRQLLLWNGFKTWKTVTCTEQHVTGMTCRNA